MRIKNSIQNLLTASLGQILSIVVTFISRLVFVHTLGVEYLGVNGLFTNVLSLLSLAEMGVGSAIIYSLYKPLAEENKPEINALMNFYRKIYHIIGFVVLCLGLLLLPFLKYLIKDIDAIPNLYLIYILFLANSVTTYFFAYKRSIVIADQKEYIVNYYHYGIFFIVNILQILVLFLLGNFIVFLVVKIFFSILENILISRKSEKIYPFLKDVKHFSLDKNDVHKIFRNVRAMLYHRVGTVIVNGTDNILMSKFVGIITVGIYSNYYLVLGAINLIIGQFFSSLTASVGNLNAVESREKSLKVYKSILFANFWLFSFASTSLWVLLNSFITLWLGTKFIMDEAIVLIIVINFFVNGVRKTTLMFIDSLGLFWETRYKPLFESLINLVVSIVLGRYLGIAGILLGTLISTLTTCFWVEPYVLYKKGFKKNVKEYFKFYVEFTVLMLVNTIIIWLISLKIDTTSIVGFIGQLLICLIIPNLFYHIVFRNKEEYKYLTNIIVSLLKKNKYNIQQLNE